VQRSVYRYSGGDRQLSRAVQSRAALNADSAPPVDSESAAVVRDRSP
jgi:hypothetical protein